MAFEKTQVRKLRAKLQPKHIRSREADGITLRYVEGWHVIAEANRIFGFDGWDRETVEAKCVYTKQNGNRYAAAYVARIRIIVHAGSRQIAREGSGAGEATTDSPGSAHEMASKAAETDATKRALMTFGNAFGLSLYANPVGATSASAAHNFPADASSVVAPEDGARSYVSAQPEGSDGAAPLVEESTAAAAPTLSLAKGVQFGHVEKSELAIGEPKRIRNTAHLRFVASRGCVVCGKNRAHAHHLTFSQPRALGRKVSDEFTVPLCADHHRELHLSGSERAWWVSKGIDPAPIATELWAESGIQLRDVGLVGTPTPSRHIRQPGNRR